MFKVINKIFFKNFFFLSLNQLSSVIVVLLLTPIIFQKIGSENFGLVNLALNYMMFFSIIISYGFNFNGPVLISKYENKIEETINKILSTRFILGILVMLLNIIFLISYELDSIYKKIYFFSIIILISEALNPFFYAQGKNRIDKIALLNFISKLIYAISILIFLNSNNEFIINLLLGFCSLVVFFFFWINEYAIKKMKFTLISLKSYSNVIQNNFKYFTSSLSSFLIMNSSLIILSFYSNNDELGKFALSQKFALLIRLIPAFLIQSVLQLSSKENIRGLNFEKNLEIIYYSGLVITLIFSCFFSFFSENIIYLFSGERISESTKYLEILSFLPFFAMLNAKNMVVTLVKNQKSILNKSIGFSAIICVLISLIMTHEYGALGLSFAIIITEIILYFFHTFLLYKSEK